MQTHQQMLEADASMRIHLDAAEASRRERKSVDTSPTAEPGIMDYGQSGTSMELAMGHLRESIPNGQKNRTMHAWLAMKEAVKQQELWLRAKGFL
jgi:hypothetical protein